MRVERDQPNQGRIRTRGAFAIIELLVVCAILIILYVMFMGRGTVHFQKRQQAVCAQNLQTIHIALQTYANENKDRFPSDAFSKTSDEALAILVPQYTTRTDAFTCPGTKEDKLPPAQPIKGNRLSSEPLSTPRHGILPWEIGDSELVACLRPAKVRAL